MYWSVVRTAFSYLLLQKEKDMSLKKKAIHCTSNGQNFEKTKLENTVIAFTCACI
jgi:hypothetical protein